LIHCQAQRISNNVATAVPLLTDQERAPSFPLWVQKLASESETLFLSQAVPQGNSCFRGSFALETNTSSVSDADQMALSFFLPEAQLHGVWRNYI
jgi:hypothetical protein